MTRSIKLTAIVSVVLLLSSCFSSQQIVGDGAKGNSYTSELNHNMFFGSIKDGSSNLKKWLVQQRIIPFLPNRHLVIWF